MLSREELKQIAKMQGGGAYFVSLYLNVDPITNAKGDYIIHVKNMIKNTIEGLDRATSKKVKGDLDKIDSYVLGNKRKFKKGLAILSSEERNFWREFHLSVTVRNEVIVDRTPYIKPLLDILDNYQRYVILLVGRESARLFIIHLGEIEEYTEVHTADVPGRHKKGGWFALSEKSYERHIDYHVGLHLKDVLKQLDSFLSHEYVGRLIIGGPEEAVTKARAMLPQTVADRVIGTFQAEMYAKSNEILEKAQPVLQAFEKKKEAETIDKLLTGALKNENAVIGIEDVLNALQEGRIMRLVFLEDYKQSGLICRNCGYLTVQHISICPYCKDEMQKVDYIVDLAAQKAVEHGAFVEIISENKRLQDSGSIGAFLRF